jgi:hypothetical protein
MRSRHDLSRFSRFSLLAFLRRKIGLQNYGMTSMVPAITLTSVYGNDPFALTSMVGFDPTFNNQFPLTPDSHDLSLSANLTGSSSPSYPPSQFSGLSPPSSFAPTRTLGNSYTAPSPDAITEVIQIWCRNLLDRAVGFGTVDDPSGLKRFSNVMSIFKVSCEGDKRVVER